MSQHIIPFDKPVIFARLMRRYKRFLADALVVHIHEDKTISFEVVTAHCANSGSLLGMPKQVSHLLCGWDSCIQDLPQDITHIDWAQVEANHNLPADALGPVVMLVDHGTSTTRKLRYTLEWFYDPSHNEGTQGSWVGINTHAANTMVEYALTQGWVQECKAYDTVKREVKYGKNSRVDFLLTKSSRQADAPNDTCLYLEVKSVHLKHNTIAKFPDSVTERGAKHMQELSDIITQNKGDAAVLYVIQRGDCAAFDIAREIDPQYDLATAKASAAGVKRFTYKVVGQVEWNKGTFHPYMQWNVL